MRTSLSLITERLKSTDLWFVMIVLAMSFIYDYQETITYRPQSVHVWRQTDGASLTMNYYQNGMDFLEPEIHFHSSDDYTSGYCVGEFPIIYYTAAALYHVFGPHECILRGLHLLLFYLGLFCLFKLLSILLRDKFWAMCLSLLFFTFPVIVFYANNFLPNVPAMSIAFMAWYAFVLYRQKEKKYHLYLSFALFTLAGLLKITALISMIPLLGILLLDLFNVLPKFGVRKRFIQHKWHAFTAVVFSFLAIIFWYRYAIDYNNSHQSVYFSTHTWPIWEMSNEEIFTTAKTVLGLWLGQYFHVSILIVFLVLMMFSVYKIRRYSLFFSYMNVCIAIGVLLYSLLWFLNFKNHDYYVINLLIWPLLVVTAFLDYLRRNHYRYYNSLWVKLLFGFLLWTNITYAEQQYSYRFSGWMNDNGNIPAMWDMESYLRDLGIDRKDKVISIPDPSPNHSLYIINQVGWSDLYNAAGSEADIKRLIKNGAKYIIINDVKILLSRPYLQAFIKEEMGNYGGVYVYKLSPEMAE